MNDHAKQSSLGTFVIEISLKQLVLHRPEAQQSECCLEFGTTQRTLSLELLDAAKDTTVRLPAITTFRILHYRFPMLRVASYDILTDREVLLPDNACWDDADQIGDEFTDIDATEQSDMDLSNGSGSDLESFSPIISWINLEVEATL